MVRNSSWRLNEVVVLGILSLAIGILFCGWTFLYTFTTPLTAIGFNYFFAGMWFIGGTLVPYLIRKPGSALLGELLAATLQGFFTHWGITAAVWGLMQGLGSELVFAATKYQRWDLKIMLLAGAMAGVFSYVLDFFYSEFWTLQPWVWIIQFVSIIAGAKFWAGWLAYRLGRGIQKTGITANLLSREDRIQA